MKMTGGPTSAACESLAQFDRDEEGTLSEYSDNENIFDSDSDLDEWSEGDEDTNDDEDLGRHPTVSAILSRSFSHQINWQAYHPSTVLSDYLLSMVSLFYYMVLFLMAIERRG
jgi:hypothetical protein